MSDDQEEPNQEYRPGRKRARGTVDRSLEVDYKDQRILLKTVYGSWLFGLQTESSDIDSRTIWIAPLKQVLSIRPPKEYFVAKDGIEDRSDDELGRYFYQCSRGNPERNSLLWSTPDQWLHHDPIWAPVIVGHRRLFLSMNVLGAMYGFAHNQLVYGHGLRGTPESRRKAVMHNLRLSIQGKILAETGEIVNRVTPEERELLLSIRRGDIPIEESLKMAEEYSAKLDRAIKEKPLPPEADYPALNDLLFAIRMGCQ